jgi:DNA-binding transcriptional MerR regulator
MSFTEPSGPLTIAEVAARSGLSAHTLRYDADDRARPALLQRLRATGMPMPHMPRFAELRRQGDCTIAARRALLEATATRCSSGSASPSAISPR